MSIIKIYPTKSKSKKKPGWQKEKDDYEAWLKKINSVKLFDNNKPKKATIKTFSPVVDTTTPTLHESRYAAFTLPSKQTELTSGGIKYQDPRITYRDDPEMLARELKARERKFATAPAYNKGGAQFISDDMMKDIASGKTRRR